MDIKMLDKHFALLKRMGFETITFADLAKRGPMERFANGRRPIMITVDDGYRDNLTRLLPLLEKYDFKAVVYIVTGEDHNRWDVENSAQPEKRVALMTRDELLQFAASPHIEIGGHTLTHPHLDTLSDEAQRHEIAANKAELEQLLGHSLHSFAYPYGEHNDASKQIVAKLGYRYAVATNRGPLAFHQDPYQIRRIAIFPKTDVFGLWRKVRGNYLFRKVKV